MNSSISFPSCGRWPLQISRGYGVGCDEAEGYRTGCDAQALGHQGRYSGLLLMPKVRWVASSSIFASTSFVSGKMISIDAQPFDKSLATCAARCGSGKLRRRAVSFAKRLKALPSNQYRWLYLRQVEKKSF